MSKIIKHWLGLFLFTTGLYRIGLRNRAVIVCFHRIDDRYPDSPIGCTRELFKKYCAFFAKYFRVISLAELVEKVASGQDIGGCAVITFDDGYRDNWRTAAPDLLRHKLPATFFIATGFIETDRIPWWDEEAGIVTEWMTWDEVRNLHTAGFDLAAHTINHIDLGIVSGAEAEHEIVESGRRLREETGAGVTLFSYPYGRKTQITEENRDLVKQVGYRCCVSAYGGIVRRGDDIFDLKRMPVSPWQISPYQYGLEVLREP